MKGIYSMVYPLMIILMFACTSGKKGADKNEVLKLEVQTLTQRDSYPGIESNLRFTRVFKMSVSANIKEEISFVSLLVDSVKLPIQSLKVDGDIVRNVDYTLLGQFDEISFQSSRYFYNHDSRIQMLEEEKFPLSGQTLEPGTAVLEYEHLGALRYCPLGSITPLDPLFHP